MNYDSAYIILNFPLDHMTLFLTDISFNICYVLTVNLIDYLTMLHFANRIINQVSIYLSVSSSKCVYWLGIRRKD